MESAITIFNQILKMFLMMSVGYLLYRKQTINDDTTARLSNILLMVATPCTIITSFNQTYTPEKFKGLILAFLLSLAVYAANILIARLIYKPDQRVEKFGMVFSNAGFLGIPLVTGLLGIEAVFYLSPFIVCFYLYAWTYGVILMSGDKNSVTLKKIIINPCIWAMIIGVIIFLLPVKPAQPVMEAVNSLGSMNTPLAMLVLGAYLAKSPLIHMFKNKTAYHVSVVRLVLVPAFLLAAFSLIPQTYATIRTVILVSAAAPSAVLAPVFAQMFDRDITLGAEIVSLSTILCLFTLPLVLLIAEMIW